MNDDFRRLATVMTAAALAVGLALTPALQASAAVPVGGPPPAGSPRTSSPTAGLPVFTTDTRTGPETVTNLPDGPDVTTGERTLYRIKIINKQIVSNSAGRIPIAKCAAATAGTSCNISAGVSVAVTVGVSLGVSMAAVVQGLGPTFTGGLDLSKTTTVSLNVGCSSPPLAAGQAFAAYAVGTRVNYQIQKTNIFTGKKTTSGTLTAFFPEINGIACGVI